MPATTTHRRSVTIDVSHLRESDDAARTAPATISSEFPVPRPGGYREILSHSPGAVDLSRAPLPLIESHDGSRLNIGIVEELRLVGKKLRGVIRLGNTARAKELWSDIRAGIVRNLSIGYEWLEYKERGDDVIVQSWRPYEVSLVAAGADPSAGIYRSNPMTTNTNTDNTDNTEADVRPETIAERMSRGDRRRANAAVAEERARVREIERMFTAFGHEIGPGSDARRLIDEDADLEVARRYIRELNAARVQPVPVSLGLGGGNRGILPITGGTEPVHNRGMLRHFGTDPREAEGRAFTAGMWCRAHLFGDMGARDWLKTHSRAMTTTKTSSIVPDELSNSIISLMNEYGVARQECRMWPMASDTLQIPRRVGGLTAYFVGQETAITESEGTWDNIGLAARKLATLTRVSSDLIQDSVVDLASWLADEVAQVFAMTEDSCLFNGDGTSTYGGIVGILNAMGAGGTVTAATDHDLFSEIDATDLSNLIARLPKHSRRGAKWYCSPTCAQTVFGRLLMAAGGNAAADLAAINPTAFGGFPIVTSDHLPSVTTDLSNSPMILFGNLKNGVAFGDRRQITIASDESRYLEYDQVAIRGTIRFDINCHSIDDATTAGPIVVLKGH